MSIGALLFVLRASADRRAASQPGVPVKLATPLAVEVVPEVKEKKIDTRMEQWEEQIDEVMRHLSF